MSAVTVTLYMCAVLDFEQIVCIYFMVIIHMHVTDTVCHIADGIVL